MCPFAHQWFATYPGEYSTIRTRTSPNCRVRHTAKPVSPRCSVRSTSDQSVTPNGISLSFMGSWRPERLHHLGPELRLRVDDVEVVHVLRHQEPDVVSGLPRSLREAPVHRQRNHVVL